VTAGPHTSDGLWSSPFAKNLLIKNPVDVFWCDPAALVDDAYLKNVSTISHITMMQRTTSTIKREQAWF
jgi:hypothetical protein